MGAPEHPEPTTADILTWLDHRVIAATEAMTAELGDASLCRVHRDGTVTGGVKYHEGRMAAFAEARRLIASDATAPRHALDALDRRWHDDLARHRGANAAMPWIAYASGGASATEELLAHLDECP